MSASNYQSRRIVKRSMRYSVADGSAHSAMMGLTQSYITPYALALNATTAHIGLLTSVPNLAMSLCQLAAPALCDMVGGRRKLLLPAVFLHALLWIPILLIPYVLHQSPITWLIGFVTLNMILGSVANPAWGSMMADLVPDYIRGRYFASRNRICSFITLVFSFIGGAILQFYTDDVFIGFSILFGGAAVFRFVSLYYLWRMHEPATVISISSQRLGYRAIAKELFTSNLGRFMLMAMLLNFTVMIASPFFSVYMLRDLQFSYIGYMVNISCFTISGLLFNTFWGRRADRGGNLKAVQIACWLMPLVPLNWLISSNYYFLLFAQFCSGFVWSGFNLASTNYLYDATPADNRTRYIAVFNAINGMAICLGSLLGGYIAPLLPDLLGYNMKTLFLISAVGRGLVALLLLRGLKEVRRVPKMSTANFLFRPFHRYRKHS